MEIQKRILKKLNSYTVDQVSLGRNLRPGEFGVFLSHLSIIRSQIRDSIDTVWILEDDFTPCTEIESITHSLEHLNTVDPKWDVLYTDISMKKWDGTLLFPGVSWMKKRFKTTHSKSYEKIDDVICKINSRYGLTSYILSLRGAEKVFSYFSKTPLVLPIDLQIHLIPGLKQYATLNETVTNDHSFYHDSHTKKNI